MADGEPRLSVVVSDHEGRPLAARGLSQWLRRVAPVRARGVVHVAVVPDAQVRRLNRTYRRKDRATDVLSFPASEPRAQAPGLQAPGSGPFLGDIVIASGVARRQASAAGHSPLTEFKVLALHGLLHLLGYDHERDTGTMLRLERRLRLKGGLREGLIERADPR